MSRLAWLTVDAVAGRVRPQDGKFSGEIGGPSLLYIFRGLNQRVKDQNDQLRETRRPPPAYWSGGVMA